MVATLDKITNEVYYDRANKRYRYRDTNQFAPRQAVINLTREHVAKLEKDFIQTASRLKNDNQSYRQLAELLKQIHIGKAIVAANGVDNLSKRDMDSISAILKEQFHSGKGIDGKAYGLQHLLREVGNISPKMLVHRLTMYAKSSDVTSGAIARNKASINGYTLEQRVLHGSKNCPDCIKYAGMGWVKIGTLPMPKTKCVCGANCKCSIDYK